MQRAKMKKQIIKTENAPSAIGPYNQAVKAGNTVYISRDVNCIPCFYSLIVWPNCRRCIFCFNNLFFHFCSLHR